MNCMGTSGDVDELCGTGGMGINSVGTGGDGDILCGNRLGWG